MARRGKLRRATTVGATVEVLPDRRATGISAKLRCVPVEIEDPFGDMVIALKSTRDDPLARIRAANGIDEAQYVAGRHWQACYERAELGAARALDTTRECVDGGKTVEPISTGQLAAMRDLAVAHKEVIRLHGAIGEWILRSVLGRGLSLKSLAEAIGNGGAERGYAIIFRDGLETLAVVWGYVSTISGRNVKRTLDNARNMC